MQGERLDYENERRRHETFVGRAALLARLDQWLITDQQDRWVVVTGGPGMGKSALLAAWLAQREAAGARVPHHFIRRGEYDWDDPGKLVGSLVAQLEDAFPGIREPDGDPRWHPATRLGRALSRVSQNALASRGDPLVVLIDGLDEYDQPVGAPPDDPLAAFLPHVLPAGVRLLCASRPRHPYLTSLARRQGELVSIELDAPDSAADNEATVRAYWEREAAVLGLDARFVDEAVARASGNLQHAVQLRKHMAVLPKAQRRVEDIPRGLSALHERSWERIASDELAAEGMGILCAAREALTLDELGAVAGWTDDVQRRRFLRGAKEMLVETRRRDERTGHASKGEAVEARPAENAEDEQQAPFEYRLHHDSVRRYVAEAIGERALRRYHGALAQRLATWPTTGNGAARRYALRHALVHRAEAGDWAAAWRVAGDTGFLEAKVRELGVDDTEADVVRIALRCRAEGDDVYVRRFDDLARGLARDSHWLRSDPAATAALVWNRLRRRGWSPSDLEAHLRIPGERAGFLRIRHAALRESASLVRDLVNHERRTNIDDCEVTPDGRRVISVSHEGLTIWDLETGRPLAILEDDRYLTWACAVTPDGRRAISVGLNKLTIWDLESGSLVITWVIRDPDREAERPRTLDGFARLDSQTACAVTPDGRRVVLGSSEGKLKIRDLETGRLLATLEGHREFICACAVTRDGRHVVSASADQTLKIWDLETCQLLATLEGHDASVNDCAVTPDGRRVISASTDGTLKVWDLETRHLLLTVQGTAKEYSASATVLACTVTPDGRRVLSASMDSTLKLWDLETGRTLATLEGHGWGVNACVVTPDGRRVVSGSGDGLKVWDLESLGSFEPMEGHAGHVEACVATPDGRRAITTSTDGTHKIWDIESGHVQATPVGDTKYSMPCAVFPDNRRMISAQLRTLKIWNLDTGALLTILRSTSSVKACAVSADGRRLISASREGVLQVWDLDSQRSVAILRGDYASVYELAMAQGGYSSSTSSDGTIEFRVGNLVATVPGYSDSMTACAVTPDGQCAVFTTSDGVVKIWDLETGRTLATLKGDSHGALTACAMTRDGKQLVSASEDQALQVWDLETGRLLATLTGHRGRVTACALTPDDRRVVSASADRTLKIWDLDTRECMFTFHGDSEYTTITATETAIVAGDRTGGVWFLDIPRTREQLAIQSPPARHRILFLAANPIGTDRLALDREARAIHDELERSGYRDRFEFATRWAAEPLDLLRELRKLRPSVVHFSGHGSPRAPGARVTGPSRDIIVPEHPTGDPEHGLFFQGPGGEPQWVSSDALVHAFGAAGESVKLVVLNACYSNKQAEALLACVPCVVGMAESIDDRAARSFAIGFYGGLGEGESVARAYDQGRAAIRLMGLPATPPQLRLRPEIDASQLVLVADQTGP